MNKYSPNPEMDAAIEAKVRAAMAAAGKDPWSVSEDDLVGYYKDAGFTDAEKRYMAEQHIYRQAQVVIGQRIYEAIEQSIKTRREEVIPCLTAYFEALDAGEVPA